MTFSRKATFASFASALLFFSLLLFPLEARADSIVITSGSLFIGGSPNSRNAWRALGFGFAGNNFAASGGVSDGEGRQGINSPCAFDPCQPGKTVFPNANAILAGIGEATFNGTHVSAFWSGGGTLTFTGPGVVIPDSTEPIITLTSTFTMTGTISVRDLNEETFRPVIFSTDVSGSGIATLTLQYFSLFDRGSGYILSGINYRFTPIPEPTTLLLLGTGLAGLAARYRRRRTNSDK